jgi:4-methyl-5(b-hydroxyethyl)-thiazole monophosphate biosynthesis
MNICVFYYDDFCEFETVLTYGNFKHENIYSAALENRVYASEEGQKFLPDKTIAELNPDDIDLFFIPGGNPSSLYDNQVLRNLVTSLNTKKKYIAGICGGTFLMAAYGILDNKKCTGDGSGLEEGADYMKLFERAHIVKEDVVIDGNTITATGQSFAELATDLGRLMGIYKNEEEALADYRWIKNIK